MVVFKSKDEINKYIAENLYGINFKELKPHDWERGYFIKCRRCGERKPRGKLGKDFNNFCKVLVVKDYFEIWDKVLTKLLETINGIGVEIIQTNISYRVIIHSTLKHRGLAEIFAEVEKPMLREAIIYAIAESLEQL